MDKAACSSGVKSIRSSSESPCRSNGFGLVGIGCVRELFRLVCCWGTRFVDWPDRFSGLSIKHVNEPCLDACATAGIASLSISIFIKVGAAVGHNPKGHDEPSKCQTRLPVLASRQTKLSANKLSPGRCPPYQSLVGVPVGR